MGREGGRRERRREVGRINKGSLANQAGVAINVLSSGFSRSKQNYRGPLRVKTNIVTYSFDQGSNLKYREPKTFFGSPIQTVRQSIIVLREIN